MVGSVIKTAPGIMRAALPLLSRSLAKPSMAGVTTGILMTMRGGMTPSCYSSSCSTHTSYTAVAPLAGSSSAAYKSGAAASSSPSARRAAVLDVVKAEVATHQDAFYVVDLSEVTRKHAEWVANLPRVRPFFAVKCNDDPEIISTLAAAGAGFDCASKGEMSMVLAAGVPASDIIFAHPAKQISHLHYANTNGVQKMTFDNPEELRKIARESPGAQAVLRILTDDSHSVCRLGLKFGCDLSSVRSVLALSKTLGVEVIGISYHVGSGNGHAASFGDAVRDARKAFDIAASLGLNLTLLDIGGGFPGSELGAESGSDRVQDTAVDAANPYSKHPSFKTIAGVVRQALDTHFPEGCGVTLMAEPGRFFVKSSHVLAVNVVGKRVTVDTNGSPRLNYYINDGLYGSFNCIMYDHVTCAPSLLLTASKSASEATETVYGDDTIVRLDENGTPIVSDAVGLSHAADLAEAMTPIVAAAVEERLQLEAVQLKSMTVGGGSTSSFYSMSNGQQSAAASTSSRHFGATAIAKSSSSSSSPTLGGTASRSPAFNFSSLSAPSVASTSPVHATTIWGPTCDSIDKISDVLVMPELTVGDWLVFENMGAYTIAGSCMFNGFPLSTKRYINGTKRS